MTACTGVFLRALTMQANSLSSCGCGRRAGGFISSTRGQSMSIEWFWELSISDPSEWSVNRFDKKGSRSPAFRHTKEALWIEGCFHPGVKAIISHQAQSGRAISVGQLRQKFFSDPSQWLKDGFNKRRPRSPESRDNHTKEAFRIEGWLNPPWIEKELAARLQQCAGFSDCGQRTESGKTQAVDACDYPPQLAYQGQKDEVNKNSSDTCGDVRTLCKAGQLKEALHILCQRSLPADTETYVCVLRECITMEGLSEGRQVHAHIVQSGCKPDVFLLNTLVNMYAKCGSVVDARQLFDKMPERDMSTWNIMIAGYAKHGCGRKAHEVYEQMIREGMTPNRVTFICILKACASLSDLKKGIDVHHDILKTGIVPDISLNTALVDMYAKCGSIKDARYMFDNMAQRNVVSWNVLIAGYAQHGCGREAFEIYKQMIREGVVPDKVTFICVLNGCANLAALEKGKEIHADIIKAGMTSNIILENTLVDMYAKCGSIGDARKVFDNMAKQTVVSWNAIIAGYAQHGCGREALKMYEQMTQRGVTPDRVTFICVLKACASLAALEKSKQVHADILKAGVASDIILETALVEMYAKCGNMKDAWQVFNNMVQRDVVSWSAMIAGYAQHGGGREALRLFEEMQQEGLMPDGVAFICVLSACSHVGLVNEGRHYFDSMSQDYGLTPTMEHFGCMVDLLGRGGLLNEAEDFIKTMPIEPGAQVWGAFLGACRTHGNVELAERAAKALLKLDPHNTSTYVLLSNIYGAAGRWDDQAKIRQMMEKMCITKQPESSCNEVDNQVHTLRV